jgi:tetratricopeptide (TPR) repeat protein
MQSGQIPLLLEVAGELMEDLDSRSIADGLMIAALMGEKESGRQQPLVETHLHQKIAREEVSGDRVQLGIAHYNLANWLRGQGRYREALRHYRAAVKNHPAYADRDYYYREIGSLLFGVGLYTAAARFYGEATRRGGPVWWQALHADALMLSGAMAAARDAFDKYLEAEPDPDPEWVLKRLVLDVIKSLQLPESGRRAREAMRFLPRGGTL